MIFIDSFYYSLQYVSCESTHAMGHEPLFPGSPGLVPRLLPTFLHGGHYQVQSRQTHSDGEFGTVQ